MIDLDDVSIESKIIALLWKRRFSDVVDVVATDDFDDKSNMLYVMSSLAKDLNVSDDFYGNGDSMLYVHPEVLEFYGCNSLCELNFEHVSDGWVKLE